MSLDRRHYSPNAADRKIDKTFHPIYKLGGMNYKNFNRIEALLDEITADVVNGHPKSDIMLKLTDKNELHYENQQKAFAYAVAEQYYRAVMSRLSLDRNRDAEQVKDSLYSQYLEIYRSAMEIGNFLAAKGALDSLYKLYGFDKPKADIQVKSDGGDINISFGFNNGDETSEDES